MKFKNIKNIIKNNPTLFPGIILFLIVLLPCLFGGFILNTSLSKVLSTPANLPPSSEYLLGTTSEGRDMLTLLIVSTSSTLKIGLIGGGIGFIIGTFLGLISGYLQGTWIDAIIRNITDVFLTIPPLAILIMIAASFRIVSITTMGIIIGATAWMHPTRVIRSQTLSMRERSFVQLAKLSLSSDFEIIFKEIMPNLLPYLAATFVNAVSSAILASIGLEVLGLGSQQLPTLGTIIYYALYYTAMWRGLWWWWVPPVIVVVLIFLGLFMMSMAIDKYANPKLRNE